MRWRFQSLCSRVVSSCSARAGGSWLSTRCGCSRPWRPMPFCDPDRCHDARQCARLLSADVGSAASFSERVVVSRPRCDRRRAHHAGAMAAYRARPILGAESRRLHVIAALWFVAGLAITIRVPVRSSLYAVFPSIGPALACAVSRRVVARPGTPTDWRPRHGVGARRSPAAGPGLQGAQRRFVEPAVCPGSRCKDSSMISLRFPHRASSCSRTRRVDSRTSGMHSERLERRLFASIHVERSRRAYSHPATPWRLRTKRPDTS